MKARLYRHAPLAEVKDYADLSFEELNAMLLKRTDPDIDQQTARKEFRQDLLSVKKIFCSMQRRSLETAKVYLKILEKEGIKIEQTDLLNEVEFKEGILKPENYGLGMDGMRVKILSNWFDGIHAEKFLDSVERFKKLQKMLQEQGQDVVCITHGWFLRIAQLYVDGKELDKVTKEDLLKVVPMKHLEKIELIIP